nr:hypothetical protein Iba_chr09dCG5680 [Ipomoea batatas]GME16309.1 hypothetical protein Iba_scaffold17332CG0010 [Ipomoea batatas]
MASQQTKDNLITRVENMSSIFPNCLPIYLHRSFLPLALKNSNRIAFSLIISRNNEYSYCISLIVHKMPLTVWSFIKRFADLLEPTEKLDILIDIVEFCRCSDRSLHQGV